MSFISNFVGFTKKSDLSKLGKSDTMNMFVTTTDATEHAFQKILKPMPGYENLNVDVPGEPQGTYRVSRGEDGVPVVYGVWGGKLYLIIQEDGRTTATHIGTLANSTGKCTFAETSGYGKTAPHLCVCDGSGVYAVNTTLPKAGQIADFRTIKLPIEYGTEAAEGQRIRASYICYLYGYLLVGAKDHEGADTDIFYRSYQYPFENTTTSGAIDYDIFMAETTSETEGYGKWTMSEWQPDNTLIGCANGSRFFTFGQRSFQVFTWQDSITTPFTSPDTASFLIGIKNRDSLALFGSQVFWLGAADAGDGVVYTMTGDASPQRISTDEIEAIIKKQDSTNMDAYVFRYEGHPFYVMRFKGGSGDNGETLVYDIREQGWTRMGSYDGDLEDIGCFRYTSPTYLTDGTLVFQEAGTLVKASQEYWWEHDGTPIPRFRVGGVLSSDNKVFKINSLKFLTNNGDYGSSYYEGDTNNEEPHILFSFAKNGEDIEDTAGDVEEIFLGYTGYYDYDLVIKGLGKATYLSIKVQCDCNIPFAIYGMDISATPCSSRY